jgi:uncharacterized protein YjbJ (UPF0337 family)
VQEPAYDLVIEKSHRSAVSAYQSGPPRLNSIGVGISDRPFPNPAWAWPSPCARGEQFRPVFRNRIIAYWSIEGSTGRKDTFPEESLVWSQTARAQGIVYEPQLIRTRNQIEEKFTMKLSTTEKATGKLHEVKGAIKQKAGQLTGSPCLEDKGRTEKNAGKVQNFVGKVEKSVGQ